MTPPPAAYAELEGRFRRINTLREISGLLHWDASTVMPAGGAKQRAEQLATMGVVAHEHITDPAVADLLNMAEDETDGLDDWRCANLAAMRRDWIHATAVPPDLVAALSKAGSACEMKWRETRPEGDYAGVRPLLEEVLRLSREAAAARAERLGVCAYDALLDQYEPGGRSARIDELFADLTARLPDLLGRILDKQAGEPAATLPDGPFPLAKQEALGRELIGRIGFDFDHGRLDVSLHPFCGGIPEDVRLTTRYDEGDFTSALKGILHEAGHAMYERQLPGEWRGQPVGLANGMSLHESQSLLMEMQACRSRAFLTFAAPVFRRVFGASGPAWEVDNLCRLHRRVAPGFIRVDADEVTYPAHVMLRYRLERALIDGDMTLNDLPGAWNAQMQTLLGITPPHHGLGCMQDIHWFNGAWGYFPTYTLGAMAAAQIFRAAVDRVPDIPRALMRGDFTPLMTWLAENIHAQASLLPFERMLERATGAVLDPAIFIDHLHRRYLLDAE